MAPVSCIPNSTAAMGIDRRQCHHRHRAAADAGTSTRLGIWPTGEVKQDGKPDWWMRCVASRHRASPEALLDAVDSAATDIRHFVASPPVEPTSDESASQPTPTAGAATQTRRTGDLITQPAMRQPGARSRARQSPPIPLTAFDQLTKVGGLDRLLAAWPRTGNRRSAQPLARAGAVTAESRVRVSRYVRHPPRQRGPGPDPAAEAKQLEARPNRNSTTEAIAYANAASCWPHMRSRWPIPTVQPRQRAYTVVGA